MSLNDRNISTVSRNLLFFHRSSIDNLFVKRNLSLYIRITFNIKLPGCVLCVSLYALTCHSNRADLLRSTDKRAITHIYLNLSSKWLPLRYCITSYTNRTLSFCSANAALVFPLSVYNRRKYWNESTCTGSWQDFDKNEKEQRGWDVNRSVAFSVREISTFCSKTKV